MPSQFLVSSETLWRLLLGNKEIVMNRNLGNLRVTYHSNGTLFRCFQNSKRDEQLAEFQMHAEVCSKHLDVKSLFMLFPGSRTLYLDAHFDEEFPTRGWLLETVRLLGKLAPSFFRLREHVGIATTIDESKDEKIVVFHDIDDEEGPMLIVRVSRLELEIPNRITLATQFPEVADFTHPIVRKALARLVSDDLDN